MAIVSSKVSAHPEISAHPFLPRPPPKNSEFVKFVFMSNPPQNFGELDSPPLKCTLIYKSKDSLLKETTFISNNEIKVHLNIEI